MLLLLWLLLDQEKHIFNFKLTNFIENNYGFFVIK